MHDGQGVIDAFVNVADIHFWRIEPRPWRLLNKRLIGNLNVLLRRRHEYLLANIEPHARELARPGVRFLLFTGDFTSTSMPEEFAMAGSFLDALANDGYTIAAMPGNHDAYTFESLRKRWMDQFIGRHLALRTAPALSHMPGGTPLLLIPTAHPNFLSSRGAIETSTLNAVEQLLGSCGDTVVVAGHYPLLQRTSAYRLPWSRRLHGAEPLRQMLGQSGKRILYVAGHTHRFWFDRDPDYPSLSHLVTGAFIRHDSTRNTWGEFSAVYITRDTFLVDRYVRSHTWTVQKLEA